MADRSRRQPKRPRDLNQRAASTVARARGEEPENARESVQAPDPTPEERHAAALALGRLGGRKGGPARTNKLTPEQRQESARKAAAKRWAAT
jgi:HEAT repeat protein